MATRRHRAIGSLNTVFGTCSHCGDLGRLWVCPLCRKGVLACCGPCHRELVHGVLPRVTDGRPGAAPARRARDGEEAGGYQENAIREMEDGGVVS